MIRTTRGDVSIRLCTPQDAEAYRALRLEALKGNPTAFGSDYEENLLHSDEYWHQRVRYNPEEEAIFFAEQGAGWSA